jgi:hypothetical protein
MNPPRAPDGENSRDGSDALIPKADTAEDIANDQPDEGQKPGEDRGEEESREED